MRLAYIRFFLLASLLSLAGCGSVRVISTQQLEAVDFSAFRTYAFMEMHDSEAHLLKERERAVNTLMQAISFELESRSLTPANPADLLINLGIWVEEKAQTRETNIYTNTPHYMGQRRYYWESTEEVVGTYKEGYVAVDIVDAERNELVWQGVVSGIVDSDPRKNEKQIYKAMEKLFRRFPVKPL